MVLVKNSLFDVITAFDLSRVVYKRIKWNFVWALGYNTFGIPIAAGVLFPFFLIGLPPELAALAMALSSVSVVMSSLALKLYEKPAIANMGREEPNMVSLTVGGDAKVTDISTTKTDNDDNDAHISMSHVKLIDTTDSSKLPVVDHGATTGDKILIAGGYGFSRCSCSCGNCGKSTTKLSSGTGATAGCSDESKCCDACTCGSVGGTSGGCCDSKELAVNV